MHYIPKKTVEQIIASGNDFVIAVKGNQPKLYEHLKTEFEQHAPQSIDDQLEQTRNRVTHRTVSVLNPGANLDAAWVGVQRLIRVQRTGIRSTQSTHETMFYISSVATDAVEFAQLIRDHWQIENRLHWVKDVVLREDVTPLCTGYAPENFAILRTIAVNLFRQHGFTSVTQGLRQLAHDVRRLFSFFQ